LACKLPGILSTPEAAGGRLPGYEWTTARPREWPMGARRDVKITVEIDEFHAQGGMSHAVADYVRAMLKVRSLRRAVGEALLEAESCKRKLRTAQAADAQKLLESLTEPVPGPRLLRRPTKPPAPPNRD
jgi:hypothetical protein